MSATVQCWLSPPAYSQLDHLAIEVLEKFDSWGLSYLLSPASKGEDHVVCSLRGRRAVDRYEPIPHGEARASTIALAICRAALKVLAREGKDER